MDVAFALSGVASLLLAGAFFGAGWGAGRTLLRRVHLPRPHRGLVEVAVGTGVLGYVAFALGVTGLLRRPALAGVLVVGVVALVFSRPARRVAVPPGLLGRGLPRWSGLAAAAAAGFALLGALLPEIEYDALWYHLTFPRRYLEAGWLLDLPCEHMSPTPQQVEMLYTYGLLLGDARGAKLIHLGFGLLSAVWAAVLAWRWLGARWAMLATALFLTAPTVLWEMTTAYNELPLAFAATGAVALLLEWLRTGQRRLLFFAGVLLGVGLAGKHLAFFFLAPLAIGVLLSAGRRRGAAAGVAESALFVVAALAVALPWYIRAWTMTGNPLFPMFYGPLSAMGLPLGRWDAQSESGWAAAMGRYGHGRSPAALLLLPWRATWDGVRYAGSLGPAWLLFLPLLPLTWRGLRTELRLVAVLAGTFLLLWATPFSSFQLRYLVPLVPLLAVLVAGVVRSLDGLLRRSGWRGARLWLAGTVAAVLLLNLPVFYSLADARTGWIPHTFHSVKPSAFATVLGLRDVDLYLAQRVEPYRAIQRLNAAVPADVRVVTFAEAAHFYARPELLMDYSRCVSPATWGASRGQEAEAYRLLRAAGVTHVLWDPTRRDLEPDSFAIASPRFRREYARPIHVDERAEVYELRPGSSGIPLDSSHAEHMISSAAQALILEELKHGPESPSEGGT